VTIEEYDKDNLAQSIYEHEHATRARTFAPTRTAHLRGASFRFASGQSAFVSLTLARDLHAAEVFTTLDSGMAGLNCAIEGVSSRDPDHPSFVEAFTNGYGVVVSPTATDIHGDIHV